MVSFTGVKELIYLYINFMIRKIDVIQIQFFHYLLGWFGPEFFE